MLKTKGFLHIIARITGNLNRMKTTITNKAIIKHLCDADSQQTKGFRAIRRADVLIRGNRLSVAI